ncbi:MAG: Ig-like domain-containing protein [Alcanivorax sp.]|nr:Ig-like domain-containing protein [Alcanivorax sp.]
MLMLLGSSVLAYANSNAEQARAQGLELLRKAQRAPVSELLSLAHQRRQAMEHLIAESPGQALRVALPSDRRATLPASVADQVETVTSVKGTLKVLVHDFAQGYKVEQRLQTAQGDIELHFTGQAADLETGQTVQVTGLKLGRQMAVDNHDDSNVLYLNGTNSTTGSNAQLSNTFGEQRVLVLLVNFQNDPSNQPYTLQQAQDIVFNQVDAYYRETSSGRTWLTGDVFGWYTMAMDQPTDPYNCRLTDISSAAQQAAGSAGVDPSSYDKIVYVFPYTSCFASGTGTVGGAPAEAWINGNAFTMDTVGHELGHNFGLNHSGSLDCGTSTEGGTCSTSPYGDPVDIMGNKGAGHFNARQKERLGWLDANAGEIIQAGSGTYTLSPYELAVGSGTQALKVLGHTDPATGDETWYYIEYRQATGMDSFIGDSFYATYGNLTDGVMIHRVTIPSSNTVSSLLLDMTPDTSVYYDWYDSALVAGNTYTDPVSGLTISTDSVDANGATVTIGNGGATSCVHQQPGIQVSSAKSQWGQPGQTLQYQLDVTNQDSADCSDSNFSLNVAAPSGWTATPDQGSVLLAPGASATVTLSVTSSSSAQAAYYDITTSLTSGSSGMNNAAAVTYVVQATNTAPVAANDSATLADAASPVTINVLFNDSDADGDPLTVTGATQGSKGTVVINSDGTITYMPQKRFKDYDSFSYTISDGQSQASATVSISLQSSSSITTTTGGGGGGNGGHGGGGGKKK